MTEQTLPIETFAPRTPLQEFWFYFKQNKGAVIGLTFILAVALISIFAPWIAPFDPIEQNRSALLLPPAWYEGGNSAYLLGTDDIGRDILSRIIYGTRISVFAGFIIVNFRAFFNECDVGDCCGIHSKLCAFNTCGGIE